MPIATTNPATGELVKEFAPYSRERVDEALAHAASAAAAWRATSLTERAAVISRLGANLEANRETLAGLATLEMGKTIRSARDEVSKCVFACRHFASHSAQMLAAESVTDGEFTGTVRYDPLGIVLAVMPWNFPFWQVIRAAVPAIMAGNAVVLKHASNVPRCALALEHWFFESGAPRGLFSTLLIPAAGVAALIADARIAAVTLTGSEAAGRDVAAQAGRVTKKCVMELGGSDPFIVLHDADVVRAAETAVTARVLNNGQSCICAKRFIVDDRVADQFEAAMVGRMRTLVVGDPVDDRTDVGPLALAQGVRDLKSQVDRSVAAGAHVLVGGAPIDRPGYFFAPTVLRDVPRASAAAREELFGPVAPIFRVRGADEAIALANDSSLGLGACVWTASESTASHAVNSLEAGMVFINAMVASDPRLPFGGVKGSGYGREVGVHGIREFTNIKTVRGHA